MTIKGVISTSGGDLSQSRTSLKAYIDFKFYLSQSTATLEAYVDLDFHISMLRTSLEVNVDIGNGYSGDSEVVGYDIKIVVRLQD